MNEFVPEFSRLISVARLATSGVEQTLEAKPAEREALARRFDLLELPMLQAHLTLTPKGKELVDVTGTITADVVQACVVTLEPIASHFDLKVDVLFAPEAQMTEGAGAPDIVDDDRFEYYANGKIDLGEFVAQHMGVNLDPYPRKPDAALPETEFGAKVEMLQPFAKLADAVKKKD